VGSGSIYEVVSKIETFDGGQEFNPGGVSVLSTAVHPYNTFVLNSQPRLRASCRPLPVRASCPLPASWLAGERGFGGAEAASCRADHAVSGVLACAAASRYRFTAPGRLKNQL
jgi:hypothetical protein